MSARKSPGANKGFLALVLHAHLPFVRHPEQEEFLEEEWFFEAITETYLPLLRLFEGLQKDDVRFRLTMTLSPTLLAMLKDDLLISRYLSHVTKLIELAEKEVARTKSNPAFNELAKMYQSRLKDSHYHFTDTYGSDLVAAFKKFYNLGCLEIITSAATHGFLPLMAHNKTAIKAQIKIACDDFFRLLGYRPRGIWLPECGYEAGFEDILQQEGIDYFFTDSHGVLNATPRPRSGVFAPIMTQCGVAAFGRDLASSRQVWSSEDGYPGDPLYRDFYRDIGYDADIEYIRPYAQKTGDRKMTGFKYHRITGNENEKDVYSYRQALKKVNEHAEDFVEKRLAMIDSLAPLLQDRAPLIVSPYDAELFGHWWFEGPEFLDSLFRNIAARQERIETITPSEYLARHPVNQIASPATSSWGEGGYAEVWLDPTNDWIYRHLHKAAERMTNLADNHPNATGVTKRALNQAVRELLLAQSSDWAFIMKAGAMAPYAEKRTRESLKNFTRLYTEINEKKIDESNLKDLEEKDTLFPGLDYSVYSEMTVTQK